jgi:GxxExxY protein
MTLVAKQGTTDGLQRSCENLLAFEHPFTTILNIGSHLIGGGGMELQIAETTNLTNDTNKRTLSSNCEIVFKAESYRIMGACFEVYNDLGSGFLEAVYQEALSYEFRDQSITFVPERLLPIRYKQYQLKTPYRPEFICFEGVIVELKAVSRLTDEHRAQVHNYLRATDFKLGLLVNFGQHPHLHYERIVC